MKHAFLLLATVVSMTSYAQRPVGDGIEPSLDRFDEAISARAIFYEGFENAAPPTLPTGWTTFGIENDQFKTGSAGSALGQTNQNGFWDVPLHGRFAMSNDDVCNCDKSQDVLVSRTLNLSPFNRVLLQFSAYQDGSSGQEASVEIRTEHQPWLSLHAIPSARSWRTYTLAIPTSYLKKGFQIRFRYDDNGNYSSGLAIDDIYLFEDAAEQFSLDKFFAVDAQLTGSGQLYHRIPETQARFARMQFGAQTVNDATSRKNARLAVSVLGPLIFQDTSSDWQLAPYDDQLLSFNERTRFTPYIKGDYSLTATLLTDSIDNELEDNGYSTSFSVSDSSYQRTAIPTQTRAGVWLEDQGDRFGSVFYMFKSDTIEAIKVRIHPASEAGARFRIKFFHYDTLTSSSYSSPPVVLTEADIGQTIRIPLHQKISRGKQVITIEKEAGSDRLVIGASTQTEAEDGNALIRSTGQAWLPYSFFPLIELIMPAVDGQCPGHIQYEVRDESCPGDEDGAIFTDVLGANIPFTYNWSNGAGNVPDIQNLSPGLYDLFVTDAQNCIYELNLQIQAAEPLSIQPVIIPDSCGKSTGEVDLDIQGGHSPFRVTWNGTLLSEEEKQLDKGLYSIEIEDDAGCTSNHMVSVPGTEVIGIAFAVSNASCMDSNGAVSITAFGTPPFTYLWNTGDTIDSLSLLPSGVYTLTITDSIGCQTTGRAILNDSNAAEVSVNQIDPVLCEGSAQGGIDLSIAGNPGPLQFQWSSNDTTEDLVSKLPGIYGVTVTDTSGCKSFQVATIPDQGHPLVLDWNDRGNYCHGDSAGIVELIVHGGKAPYSYVWSNGNTSSVLSELASGTYTLTLTDANQCQWVDSISIAEGSFFLGEIDSVFYDSIENFIDEGEIYVSLFGGTPPLSSLWNDSISSKDLIGVPPGYYSLVATDQMGCEVRLNYLLENGPTGTNDKSSTTKPVVYPNPVRQGESVLINSPYPIREVRWFTVEGKLLSSVQTTAFPARLFNASVPQLSNGILLLVVESTQGIFVERISILR